MAYDANGNTLSDAQGRSFTWDFENRLTQAVVPGTNGGTTTFRYDPFGRRIQKSGPLGTTNYLYDGDNSIEEVDQAGSVIAQFTQSKEIDEPLAQLRSAATTYYHADILGSTTSLTNSSATTVATYIYDAFGNLSGSSGSLLNAFRYTGREFDQETSLYYYRARYFDPQLGRFIGEDPIGFDAGDNFYRYVENNPFKFMDPFGLSDLVVNCQNGTITVVGSNGQVIAVYPAGNATTNPAGDPNTVGSNGPAPAGTFPVQRPVNTDGRPEYGPFFFPVGAVDDHGRPTDIARRRGIGIHAGRRGPQSRTQGCIRVSDHTVRDLVDIDRQDPIRTVTIR